MTGEGSPAAPALGAVSNGGRGRRSSCKIRELGVACDASQLPVMTGKLWLARFVLLVFSGRARPGVSMDIWTRQHDQLDWTPWPDVPRGLAKLLDTPDAQVLLLTEAPDIEHDLLIAAVRLVHALVANGGSIVVASPHPSVDLIDSLRPVGVDHVWVVERPGFGRKASIQNVSEISATVCPHLHSKTGGGTTLTVCGRHHDRMVLARHHLDRWCLRYNGECPHRRRGDGDA